MKYFCAAEARATLSVTQYPGQHHWCKTLGQTPSLVVAAQTVNLTTCTTMLMYENPGGRSAQRATQRDSYAEQRSLEAAAPVRLASESNRSSRSAIQSKAKHSDAKINFGAANSDDVNAGSARANKPQIFWSAPRSDLVLRAGLMAPALTGGDPERRDSQRFDPPAPCLRCCAEQRR